MPGADSAGPCTGLLPRAFEEGAASAVGTTLDLVVKDAGCSGCPRTACAPIASPPAAPASGSPILPGLCCVRCVAGSVTAGAVPGAGGAASVRWRPQQHHHSLEHFPGRWERRHHRGYRQDGCQQREGRSAPCLWKGEQCLWPKGRMTGGKGRDWFDARGQWWPPVS